jgi:hypothetical protein
MPIDRFKTGDTASPTTNEPPITILTEWPLGQEKPPHLVPPGDTDVSRQRYKPPGFKLREAMRR